jgi:hypothetical protein
MTPQTQDLGKKLCAVLGLPKRVLWFELRVAYDEAVTVKCEYHPESVDGRPTIDTVLAEYEFEVVSREVQPAPDERFSFDAWLNARKAAAHAAMLAQHQALSRMDERLFCHG